MQSNPDVLGNIYPFFLTVCSLKSINPQDLKWTSRKKKKNSKWAAEAKGLLFSLNSVAFFEIAVWPGLFQGLSDKAVPKNKESASYNIVLRERRDVPPTSVSVEEDRTDPVSSLMSCRLQNGRHSVEHYEACLSDPDLSLFMDERALLWIHFNLIYKEFSQFAAHA